MTVTDDTTVGEIRAWLDEHKAKITFQVAPQYPPESIRPLAVELDEAMHKFAQAQAGFCPSSWKCPP